MITKEEIEAKGEEFEIHVANVQRDYVFGWLLAAIYSATELRTILILKGGNAFRKAYFEATRFSADLDFSTQQSINPEFLAGELNKACQLVRERAGVAFDIESTRVETKEFAHLSSEPARTIYEVRLYFQDFHGQREGVLISVRMDVAELDRIFLPIQTRNLIHPYSDAGECKAEIRCVQLEELLATKLKCLLQRRRAFDLYDYIFSVFIKHELAVDRGEIVRVFLGKTIFRSDPGAARDLLLGLPFERFEDAWNKYIVCPRQAWIDFGEGLSRFKEDIASLFGSFGFRRAQVAFFPAHYRNPIMDAGSSMTLLRLTYHGVQRDIEPYSLVYKRRRDGVEQEYFYGYDRTGGQRSGPGIKTFVASDVQRLEATEEKFEPRFPVELSKAGEPAGKGYFGSPFSRPGAVRSAVGPRSVGRSRSGVIYILQCPYCMKTFRRSVRSTRLNKHTDNYGNRCYGRVGTIIDQTWR